jgi:hypothetical protein
MQDEAWAHATERGMVMLLPTHYYLFGGTLAVVVSFTILGLVPAPCIRRAFAWRSKAWIVPTVVPLSLSWCSFLLLVCLIYVGFAGSRDPLANLLPLTIWTIGWVGLTLCHGLFGDLWAALNPWSGPYGLVARGFLRKSSSQDAQGYLRLPTAMGYGPAIIGFAAFAWFELISLAPDDPDLLATVVIAYWIYTFVGMLIFGKKDWCERAECFAVFFRLVSCLAVVQPGNRGLVFSVPGAGVLSHPALPVSGALFLLLTLASVSFDGLNKTFWWLGLNGINPLAFPGRSAVTWMNTAGLILTFFLLSAGYLLAIWIGWRLAGRSGSLTDHIGGFVLSMIPISLAFHMAHYLAVLLINGQYTLVAASNPLSQKLDLLGYAHYHVTGSWLTHHDTVALIWKVQAGVIVIGHILGVIFAHALALKHYGQTRMAVISQAPLTVVMVAYTLFGLWLLATPVAG